ncbi:MAG: glycosyltransferase family 4 protein [Trebonia sp.]|jgi:glycosyltransferase involved in cell wall biosynthesis
MSAIDQLNGRRILFLNWRDRANPAAGGAESYTEQIAQRFARAGVAVTLFTSEYRGGQPYDWSNGYLVMRKGGRFGVYAAAARHLRRYARQYDAVVDFQNGIPFFAPLWSPPELPVLCVVHHVHQRQFDTYFRWPMNHVGRMLEGRASRLVYRGRPMIAVSPSTRAEMRRELRFRGHVHIVPNGIDQLRQDPARRSARPTIALVTRMVAHKQLDHLIAAVPALLERWPDLRVVIAGTGEASGALAAQVSKLRLGDVVELPGRVSEAAKFELLGAAWLTVAPSAAEGWGLTIMEANAIGTPAVAYDVPGLRDSVRHGMTGWLVRHGQNLASALTDALAELSEPGRRAQIGAAAKAWAGAFSWDSSADRLAGVLLAEMKHRQLGGPERRQAVDLATVACWPAELAAEIMPALKGGLRSTDTVVSDAAGVRALLAGCDEIGAVRALSRVGVLLPELRLATRASVLALPSGELR